MNREHLEKLASAEWRQTLEKHVFPFALGERSLGELGDDVLEIGPGPGLTTDVVRAAVPRLTAVELDEELADALTARMQGTNVTVVNEDATRTSLPDGRFSGAIMLTMLHHVPTSELQDLLFGEAVRVLRPGGLVVMCDGVATDDLEGLHAGDIYNPIDPAMLETRMRTAGFVDVDVRSNAFLWACHATTPATS